VTGRPAGWCDLIARIWPVDAVIGENGAFYFRYDHEARLMTRGFWLSAEEREAARQRLDRLTGEILAAVPGAPPTSPIARPTSPSMSPRIPARCRRPKSTGSSR
jgi:hypothetical protein